MFYTSKNYIDMIYIAPHVMTDVENDVIASKKCWQTQYVLSWNYENTMKTVKLVYAGWSLMYHKHLWARIKQGSLVFVNHDVLQNMTILSIYNILKIFSAVGTLKLLMFKGDKELWLTRRNSSIIITFSA